MSTVIDVPVIAERSYQCKQVRVGKYTLNERNVIDLIHPSWYEFFLSKGYTHNKRMMAIFKSAYSADYRIIPSCDQIYKVFSMAVDDVKVVIVGQDPYPGWDKERNADVACGLSFATESMETPCSLKRIKDAINEKFGKILITNKSCPNGLSGWIEQGVFLMNNTPVLASKKEKTEKDSIRLPETIWEGMTAEICKYISIVKPNCRFILVGSKAHYIRQSVSKCVITNHPSTMSSQEFTGDCFVSVTGIDWTRF